MHFISPQQENALEPGTKKQQAAPLPARPDDEAAAEHVKRIKDLEKENRRLTRELSRLANTLERNKAVAKTTRNLDVLRATEQRKQEQYMQRLLENSPDLILLLDSEGRFAYCTDIFLKIFGIPHFERINGRHFEEVFRTFISDEHAEGALKRIADAKTHRRTIVSKIIINGAYTDGTHYFMAHVTPVFLPSGEFDGTIVLYHDVTDLRRSRILAEEANAAKSDFLASMSHEIRTPMNAIIGMSDLIRTDNLDDRQRHFFADIRKMSRVLLQIINDILDFSRIEAGKMAINPVHFNLMALCDNLASMSEFMAKTKQLNFFHHFDEDIPQVIFGDDVRIQQIITNLLSNAVKYTENGHIRFDVLRMEKDGRDCIAFVVNDTGMGIREEDFDKLFGIFERLGSQSSKGIEGTGLGLPITKSILEMMDGNIHLASTYGKGSTFTATIPLIPGDPLKTEATSLSSYVVATQNVNVLLVDDNPVNLKVAQSFLGRHNIHADTAESGQEAIRMIQEKRYDMVFMDHMMPRMSGIEAARRIRELDADWYREMPIIALTANAISGAKEQFLSAGMSDFLAKPIEGKLLNLILSKWLPADKKEVSDGTTLTAAEYDEGSDHTATMLDRQAGLKNMAGDPALYQQLLDNFATEKANLFKQVATAIETKDIPLAHRLAHTLKSNAALIGASRLSQVAFAMEKALADENLPYARLQMKTLDIEFRAVMSQLGETAAPESLSVKETLEHSDMARAGVLIERLIPLLSSGNTRCLDMLPEIEETFLPFGDTGKILVRQIENFEFNLALDMLLPMRGRCDNA